MQTAMKTPPSRRRTFKTVSNTALQLLLAGCIAGGIAYAQEPPPYPGGGDAAQPTDQAPPPDQAQGADQGANAPAAVSVDYFHDQLSSYGQWVWRPGYGAVWVPQVDNGWRPYTTGHWAYTDQGWAWVGDEPWGWAAYHYGRWYYDQDIGWGWVPGTVWAPAWVSWRHGGGYLGWAPLPPSVGFSVGVGLVWGGVVISPGYYTFVGERDILSPRIGGFIVASSRNTVIVHNATIINNYTVVNNHIVNGGVSASYIQQVTGRPVPQVTVASMAAGSAGRPGAFYQPPAIAKVSNINHAEFGKSLATQVSAQQRSRSFAQIAANPKSIVSGGARGTAGVSGSTRSTAASSATRRQITDSSLHHTTGSSTSTTGGHSTGGGSSTHLRSTGSSVHSTGSGSPSGAGGASSSSGGAAAGTSSSRGHTTSTGNGSGTSSTGGGHTPPPPQAQTKSQPAPPKSPPPPPPKERKPPA
jgi:hypothetical protein